MNWKQAAISGLCCAVLGGLATRMIWPERTRQPDALEVASMVRTAEPMSRATDPPRAARLTPEAAAEALPDRALSAITGNSDDFDDRRIVEEWAQRNPGELIEWVLALPETLLKRRKLYTMVCMALADHHPGRLKDLVTRSGSMFLETPVIDVLARMDEAQVGEFLSAVEPAGIDVSRHLPDIAVVREIQRNGFDAALRMVCNEPSADVTRSVRALMDNLPDYSPETLENLYAHIRESYWWGKDDTADHLVSKTVGKFNGELAVREALRLPGILGQSASGSAFLEWFKTDPNAALEFLPRSGVTDTNTLVGWLHAIKKYADDPGLSAEAEELLGQLQPDAGR